MGGKIFHKSGKVDGVRVDSRHMMVYGFFMRMIRLISFLILLAAPVLAQGLVAFSHDHLVIITADGKHHNFDIELAQTPEQQTQGLMYRRTLGADAGMLFDFHQIKPVAMWMKNTALPLDMIFIAADGTIAGIAERTVPQSQDIISSPGAVRAVLEVNGGTSARLGLKTGDRIEYPLFSPAK